MQVREPLLRIGLVRVTILGFYRVITLGFLGFSSFDTMKVLNDVYLSSGSVGFDFIRFGSPWVSGFWVFQVLPQ